MAIDASATISGGAVTHLVSILKMIDIENSKFSEIHVWAPKNTLAKINNASWLYKHDSIFIEKNYIIRALWQSLMLKKDVIKNDCDILLIIGGSFSTNFRPIIVMNQNLIPFVWREIIQYKFSLITIKFLMLRIFQSLSFKSADGVIFLSKHAKEIVTSEIGANLHLTKIIPHGIERNTFYKDSKKEVSQLNTNSEVFNLLYVSSVDYYKHQWNVVSAVSKARSIGINININFIGPGYKKAIHKLENTINQFDPNRDYAHYLGAIPHEKIQYYYNNADAFIFASTCETFGMALVEAMSSGLPIICSNLKPMTDILGDGGFYFDPYDDESIAKAIITCHNSIEDRKKKSDISFNRSLDYSWEHCADETFSFIEDVYIDYKGNSD